MDKSEKVYFGYTNHNGKMYPVKWFDLPTDGNGKVSVTGDVIELRQPDETKMSLDELATRFPYKG